MMLSTTHLRPLAYFFISVAAGIPNAHAGKADVLDVQARCNSQRQCDFAVTVRHDDSGWDHYANRWEVLSPDGDTIATRTLLHPHETEQPFTRYLNRVEIPKGVDRVMVRAHDSVHKFGGETVSAELVFENE